MEKKLTPEEYRVLRGKGTETPFTDTLLHEKNDETYDCRAYGNPLFEAKAKFDSGTGWPSFDDAISQSIKLVEDNTLGVVRTEVLCAKCGSHLGHVFPDGFGTPTGDRYCMNSIALDFEAGE